MDANTNKYLEALEELSLYDLNYEKNKFVVYDYEDPNLKIAKNRKILRELIDGWESLKTELKNSAYTHIFDIDLSVFRCIANIQNMMDNIESGRDINDFGDVFDEVDE